MPVYRLPATGVAFPDPFDAGPDGLLAVGGELTPQRLLAGYRIGVFPWYDARSPRLWWTPDPRCIMLPEDFHLPKSLGRYMRTGRLRHSFDLAFGEVIRCCARPRDGHDQTWLVPEMIKAYETLHQLGFAHSVESWVGDKLVGGLYGVAIGSVFFGESMFFKEANASKAAFAHLASSLAGAGFTLIDCQQTTPNLLRFGAKPVPRKEFMDLLGRAVAKSGQPGTWADGIAPVIDENIL